MNRHPHLLVATAITALTLSAVGAAAQATSGTGSAAAGGAPSMAAVEPGAVRIFFETGSARISPDQTGILDTVVRTFSSGDFVLVEIDGMADAVGAPDANLDLSFRRARSVYDGLTARGMDPLQLQVRARGNSELPVETPDGVSEARNRVAEITWR